MDLDQRAIALAIDNEVEQFDLYSPTLTKDADEMVFWYGFLNDFLRKLAE